VLQLGAVVFVLGYIVNLALGVEYLFLLATPCLLLSTKELKKELTELNIKPSPQVWVTSV
jgi:hypothetical protein